MSLTSDIRGMIPKKSRERSELVNKLRELKQRLSTLKKNDRSEEAKIRKDIAKQKLLIKQYDISERVKKYGGEKK